MFHIIWKNCFVLLLFICRLDYFTIFLAKYIPGASIQVIDSLNGHDGFLIESGLMTKAVRLWQKLQRLEVNPMADFFQALEAKMLSHEIS